MRYGIRSVTMDDVSRELGISKKTLYQHFDNKDNLVEAVISTHVEREQKCMSTISEAAQNALDEIRAIGVFITTTIKDVSQSTMFDLQKYYRHLWELLTQKQDCQIKESIEKNLERGIQEGLYRPDLDKEVVAKIYAKATYFVLDELSLPASNYTRKQLVWELHNYHVHAIATEKGLALWKSYTNDAKEYDTASTLN